MIRIDDSFSGSSCVNDQTYPSGSDVHMHVSRIFNVHAGRMEIWDSIGFQNTIGPRCSEYGESRWFKLFCHINDRWFVFILNTDKNTCFFQNGVTKASYFTWYPKMGVWKLLYFTWCPMVPKCRGLENARNSRGVLRRPKAGISKITYFTLILRCQF